MSTAANSEPVGNACINAASFTDFDALYESSIRSLPLIARGKVRDLYAVGESHVLMVTGDRLSAFDVVMTEPIPGKGKVLHEMSVFWFDRLRALVPNHLTDIDPESVVAPGERDQVKGQGPFGGGHALKATARRSSRQGLSYRFGWKDYQRDQAVCGVPLPAGLKTGRQTSAKHFYPCSQSFDRCA
jgi:phosphoribosylaminoimidazole-succinocarboxamide synthase